MRTGPKNMYNLNTKRAVVEEGGVIEWVSGSFGSHVSCLYPMSILKGKDSRAEFTGITFAGKGQCLDTGAKIVHQGENTSSFINTRSISKDGGISTFRSSVVVAKDAKQSRAAVSCQSLMLDSFSRSDTIPAMDIRTPDADIGHEARIGRISEDAVILPDVARHRGGRRQSYDSQRLCRKCFQGAAVGIRGGDEQSDTAGNERQHRITARRRKKIFCLQRACILFFKTRRKASARRRIRNLLCKTVGG